MIRPTLNTGQKERVCPRCRKEISVRNAMTGRLNFTAAGYCKPCQIARNKLYFKSDAGKLARNRSEVRKWAKGKLPKWMRDA